MSIGSGAFPGQVEGAAPAVDLGQRAQERRDVEQAAQRGHRLDLAAREVDHRLDRRVLGDQRQVAAGEVDHELAQVLGVRLDEAGDAAAADAGADADGDRRLHRRLAGTQWTR